jgi:hypothetical protein
LNIDGCRVDAAGADLSRVNNVSLGSASGGIYGKAGAFTSEGSVLGRWPANLILTYPEDEYMLRDDVTAEHLHKLAEWLNENSKH